MMDSDAADLFQEDLKKIHLGADRMFFWLLIAQWAAAVGIALVWSPRTWIAQYWSVHEHVSAAVVLGGLFAAYPLWRIARAPGSRSTRHAIAVGQMLQSALLVHVTGGRIETHFHVFGSLALLAFYRDWLVLITAAAVVYIDHLALGAWFPLSAYGVKEATIWRSFEHALWVLFEAAFLIMSCRAGIRELRGIAAREVQLQRTAEELRQMSKTLQHSNQELETRVSERTENLEEAKQKLEEKVRELEFMNKVMMGREEKIMELKEQLRALNSKGPEE